MSNCSRSHVSEQKVAHAPAPTPATMAGIAGAHLCGPATSHNNAYAISAVFCHKKVQELEHVANFVKHLSSTENVKVDAAARKYNQKIKMVEDAYNTVCAGYYAQIATHEAEYERLSELIDEMQRQREMQGQVVQEDANTMTALKKLSACISDLEAVEEVVEEVVEEPSILALYEQQREEHGVIMATYTKLSALSEKYNSALSKINHDRDIERSEEVKYRESLMSAYDMVFAKASNYLNLARMFMEKSDEVNAAPYTCL